MLSIDYLMNYFGQDVFHHGEDVYAKGMVADLDVSTDPESGLTTIETTVTLPSNRELFVVAVINEAKGWIFDCECECQSFRTNGKCAHIVAAILKYLNEAVSEEVEEERPLRKTDASLKTLLTRLEQAPIDERADTDVKLIPYIAMDALDSDAVHVEFRLQKKDDKMYILQNITEFVSLLDHHSYKKYGKDLEFIHDPSTFQKDCRKLVIFLRSIVNREDTYRLQKSVYSYSLEEELKRQLSLKGRYLDAFMQAVSDLEIHFMEPSTTYGYIGDEIYHKQEGLPDIQARIEKADDGFLLTGADIHMFKGNNSLYIFDHRKHVFYVADRTSEKLVALLDFMQMTHGEPQYVSQEDLPAFARDLYPVLEKTVHLENSGFDSNLYLPEIPVYQMYIDSTADDVVSCELYAKYSDNRYNVFAGIKAEGKRNVSEEKHMDGYVSQWFTSFDPIKKRMIIAKNEEKMFAFLHEGIKSLQEKGEVYISDSIRKLTVKPLGKFSLNLSVTNENLLQLDLVADTLTTNQIIEILSKYDPKKKFFRLKNGEFIDLEDNPAFEQFAQIAENLHISSKDLEDQSVTLPRYRALYLEDEMDETLMDINRDERFRKLISNIRDVDIDAYEPPKQLGKIMRDYQKEGFRWLSVLYANGFGALLADEMGLGKTLQVLSFLYANRKKGKALVVCPASLVYNWYSEIKKFTPDLPARMIVGPAEVREELIRSSSKNEILITSYNLLKRDLEYYDGMHFAFQIIDEAQYIKNAATLSSRSVKDIQSDFKIALTGTPIENRLSELWSIFDFIMPGFFYSYNQFRANYEVPIIRDQDQYYEVMLQKMISPFVLRRLKKNVLKDLPDKLEEVYYASAEEAQRELYDARVQMLKHQLSITTDEQFKANKIQILAELTKLRQICCDPSLLYADYEGGSAKEDMCIDLIVNAVEAGHKVLLFSQFTSMLDLLCKRLQEEHIDFYLLTGGTPKQERARMVESFQSDAVPVFCISLKAGGTGLNLTAADIVIHYDPWWNTAVQNQASDRAHRIGQKNVVTVYRLILKDTIEDRILRLQEDKADLAGRLLDGENMSSANITRDDLLNLL